jgi:hypothetical protein
MASPKSENNVVELVFPRPKREMDVYLPKAKGEEFFQIFSTDVNSVEDWFSDYEIESMQLKIKSIINSSQTTKLILGSKADNGLTIILKPKSKTITNSTQDLSEIQQDSKVEM